MDSIENSFANGVRIVSSYPWKNLPFVAAALVLALKGALLLASGETALSVVVPALYLVSFAFPILALTPQLFNRPQPARERAKELPGLAESPETTKN